MARALFVYMRAKAIDVLAMSAETKVLIEKALASARAPEHAHADGAGEILPSSLLEDERTPSVIILSAAGVEVAPSPARTADERSSGRLGVAVANPRASYAGVKTAKSQRRRVRSSSRWALLACAFVASVAAGAAFMASPLGRRPDVQGVLRMAEVHVTHAAQSSASKLHLATRTARTAARPR